VHYLFAISASSDREKEAAVCNSTQQYNRCTRESNLKVGQKASELRFFTFLQAKSSQTKDSRTPAGRGSQYFAVT
jgi:hypothetical protein